MVPTPKAFGVAPAHDLGVGGHARGHSLLHFFRRQPGRPDHFQQYSSCWTRSLPDQYRFCYNNIIGKQKYFSHSLARKLTPKVFASRQAGSFAINF